MLLGTQVQTHKISSLLPGEIMEKMATMLSVVASQRCKVSYATLFNYFAPRLRSYALKQLGTEAQAMELVQETMTNVWQKAHLFNPEKGSPSTWIFTIARNIRFDMLRKQQNRKEDICSDDLWPVLCEQTAPANEVSLEQQITLEQINELFGELPEKQRVVMEAVYVEGRSQQEVADELNVPLGTVKSRTRLALQRLKELLKDYD